MKNCSFLFFVLVVFAGLVTSETAWAYTDGQIHEMVQSRLLDRHPNDTPEWWRSLGDNSVGVIIGMYASENNTFHRIRLLQGLGWMDNQQAIDFVKQQAQQTDLDTLRNAAIRAVARGQGAKEIDFVSKWLKDNDPQTRLAAAESLKEIAATRDPRASRAKDLYDAFLKEEKTPWMLDKLNGKIGVAGSIRPVASSEDRVSPDLEGTWRGYWVAPKSGVKGMQSAGVLLQIKTADINTVGGSLSVLSHGKVEHTFTIDSASGHGAEILGNLIENLQQKQGTRLTFKGGLTRMGDTVLLELRVPEKASVLVLKKD